MATLSDPDSAWERRRRLDCGTRGENESSFNLDLWARLPEFLIEEILAKVPFSSLVRFCSVCKRWRDLILSSAAFPRRTSGHPLLVDFSGHAMSFFRSTSGTWETVPLNWSTVPGDMIMSAGGLLCFHTFVAGEYFVINPLTKCRKRLQMPCKETLENFDQPCMPIPRDGSLANLLLSVFLLVGMVVDGDTGHFKLIVGGVFPGSQGTTLVYDSRADSWRKAANIPEGVFNDLVFTKPKNLQTTECGGNLYFYMNQIKHSRPREDRLLKYHVEEQAWSWIPMPKHAKNRYVETSRNIILHNGKILLVTPTCLPRRRNQNMMEMTLQVLELQDTGSTLWMRTSRLPLPRTLEEIPLSRVGEELPLGTSIECFGQGDVLFFVRRNKSLHSKKFSVRKWFHNVSTNTVVFSDWADCLLVENSADFKILMPSTTLLSV